MRTLRDPDRIWRPGRLRDEAGRRPDGEVVNFYVHYEIDGDTSAHVLKLEDYGGNDENAWVLLEEVEEAAQ